LIGSFRDSRENQGFTCTGPGLIVAVNVVFAVSMVDSAFVKNGGEK